MELLGFYCDFRSEVLSSDEIPMGGLFEKGKVLPVSFLVCSELLIEKALLKLKLLT